MHVKFAADINAIQYMLLFIIFKNLKFAGRILRIVFLLFDIFVIVSFRY